MADAATAVGRILRRGAADEHRELVAGVGELGQPGQHLGQPPGDQPGHVLARRLAAVADGQHLADLPEGEPGRLGLPDERQAVENAR